MKEIPWFNRGMHHLDIQQIGESFYAVYDGDRNMNGKKAFQVNRTLKFIYWYDFYNYRNTVNFKSFYIEHKKYKKNTILIVRISMK